MPNKEFIIVESYSEMSKYLDKRYNPPLYTEGFNKENFEEEYSSVYSKIRGRLEIFGDLIDSGEKGISLGPSSTSRKIGIVLDSEKYFRPELIKAIQEVLKETEQDYLVYIDGEYAPGVKPFYICITKNTVLGYAADAGSLQPFGFGIS